MNIPQPFQYQGSKRRLAPRILDLLPRKMTRLVEPFAGSGAISLACAGNHRCHEYWLNDLNHPLSELLYLIVNEPKKISDFYRSIWHDRHANHVEHYYSVRDEFNRTNDPKLLLYLLSRCVKGSVRYNSEGHFNQSPDKRRLGTTPDRMQTNIQLVSMLLRGKSVFTSLDFREVFSSIEASDVIYMDPPYQGTSESRDHRYSSGIHYDDFVTSLEYLNRKNARYLISYDGRLGGKNYGKKLPNCLNLVALEIEAGRSTQATFLGQNSITIESLYLSRSLVDEIGEDIATVSCKSNQHTDLLEGLISYV